jgi:hypothetical protein
MRKRTAQTKTVDRHSVVAEESERAGVFPVDRQTRDLPLPRAGVVLLFGLGLVLAIFWSAEVRPRETEHASTIANLTDDGLFGFGSAALAACGSSATVTFEQLSRSVSSPADGTISPDISRGFAAFAELGTRLGEEAACGVAFDAISARNGAR